MNGSDYIKNIRSKVGNDTLLLPSVAAVILNNRNEILLQEKHEEPWSLPAGMIEPGESPREAIIREVEEETGLIVKPIRILGLFGGNGFSYTYPNGHNVDYTVLLMLCEVTGNSDSIPDMETKSLSYFTRDSMPKLALPYPKEVLFDEVAEPYIK